MAHLTRRTIVVVALLAALQAVGHANEGFWPFNRIPKAAIKQALGVELSEQWIERVQQASVRFPSGSGSFVSPDGLVLTNHHVSLDLLHKMSTPERDYASKGFLAADRNGELKAADLELMTLQKIEDVTAQVNEAVKPGMSSAGTLAARRAAIAAIEKDAQAATDLEAETVTLYQGAQYHLYLYKKFTDVRLVFAPEFDAAFFGGDPDNFTFPRYCSTWRSSASTRTAARCRSRTSCRGPPPERRKASRSSPRVTLERRSASTRSCISSTYGTRRCHSTSTPTAACATRWAPTPSRGPSRSGRPRTCSSRSRTRSSRGKGSWGA